MSETPYVETEVVLAVLNGEDAKALALLQAMHAGELADFLRVVHLVEYLIEIARSRAVDSSSEA